MWLHEIFAPERILSATARFRDTFKSYRQVHSNLDTILREFVEFRLTHRPDDSYGAKDSAFISKELKGFRHFHMVHGRVILIYQLTSTELRLCLVMDHNYSTKKGQSSLGNYLNSPSIDFNPISLGQSPKQITLSKEQIDEITSLFFEFAAEDRNGLIQAVSGDMSELLEFVRLVIHAPWDDEQKDRAIFQAYGGRDGFRNAVQKVLQQTARKTPDI